jgi:hypothetical protein
MEPDSYRAVVEGLLGEEAGVSETKMMGMPSLKVAGKLFAGLHGSALAVKLGRERVQALLGQGRAAELDPSGRGRPMKDWAVIDDPGADWIGFAREALERTRTEAGA